jgi:alkylation response protein AidB-like acyl-CoA dehydrogenase
MNFDFDTEQVELRDTVARALANGADWNALSELGLFALLVPETQGGVGMTLVDVALILQRLGSTLAPVAVADTLVATDLIVRFGSTAQQAKYLPAIAAGGRRVALAWQEADAGYGVGDMLMSFNGSQLSGHKIVVADAGDANLFVVATASGLVMVDRAASGVTCTPHQSLDPSCHHHAIRFDGAAAEAFGTADAMTHMFDLAATAQALMLLGVAEKMLALAADYARERVQFDRPIGSFQGIKHKCADMAVAVEAAKSVAYYAAWAVAEHAPDRARASSMAKAWCGDTASKVGADAVQVHGGMGFTWELGLHHYLRRAKVMAAAYGDANWHRERVITATLAELQAG